MALAMDNTNFKMEPKTMTHEIKNDPEMAWGYFCNIAMPIVDVTGVSHELANQAAAYVMLCLFDVDITKDSRYEYGKSPIQQYHEARVADGG